jgi:hypothetical protein
MRARRVLARLGAIVVTVPLLVATTGLAARADTGTTTVAAGDVSAGGTFVHYADFGGPIGSDHTYGQDGGRGTPTDGCVAVDASIGLHCTVSWALDEPLCDPHYQILVGYAWFTDLGGYTTIYKLTGASALVGGVFDGVPAKAGWRPGRIHIDATDGCDNTLAETVTEVGVPDVPLGVAPGPRAARFTGYVTYA